MTLIITLLLLAVPVTLAALQNNGEKRALNEYCILECAGYQAYPRKSGYNGYMY
jgi:hypothetical protein